MSNSRRLNFSFREGTLEAGDVVVSEGYHTQGECNELKILMTGLAMTLACSGAVLAADKPSPQNVPGTAVEGNATEKNPGA